MKQKKSRPFLRNFFLVAGSFALLAAASYGAFRVGQTLLDRSVFSRPNSSAVPAASAGSSAADSFPQAPPAASASSPGVSSAAAPQSGQPALNGIFAAYSSAAQQKLSTMSLKEKVGQVFLLRCPQSGAVETVRELQPAGYFLMADVFQGKTTAQVKSMTASFQSASKTKMVLGCDEEGGTVVRASKYSALAKTPFRSPQAVFRSGGLNAVYSDTAAKAKFLKNLGLNLNLAPVCDVSTNPKDFIYARSFGKDAKQTAQFVKTSVQAYRSQNLSCTLKHFPGYGNNADTHTGIAYDKRSYQTFVQSDFLPFQAGIEAGAPCILVSHNIVTNMDAKNPASLSPQVHEILRKDLNFTGIIMTDDLIMGAIRDFTGGKNPCAAALNAGNDLLLSSNPQEDCNALYTAVQNGTVSEARLNESVLRVLAWKYKMGIL